MTRDAGEDPTDEDEPTEGEPPDSAGSSDGPSSRDASRTGEARSDTPATSRRNQQEQPEATPTDRQNSPANAQGKAVGGSSSLRARWDGRRVLRHAVVLVLAIALALAPLAIIGGAFVPGDAPPERQGTLDQPECTSTERMAPEPGVHATIERVDDTSQVRVTYDLSGPTAPEQFIVSTAGLDVNVVDASGFDASGFRDGTYEWTGEGRPSLTYSVPEEASGSLADESPRYSVGDDWALAPLPRPVEAAVNYDPAPNGVVSPADSGLRIAYLGTIRTTNATHGCQTISIHTPPDSSVDGEELSTAVAEAAAEYPVGQRPSHVEGVVVPLPGSLGGYTLGTFFTVNPTSNLSAETIAVHEYVHTRQRAEYEPEMQWFVEGQPAFYMFKLRYAAGQLTTAEYALQMHTFHDRARWGDSFQRETNINHYYRGASTLAALDFRIRAATDGERSLLDVVQRLETRQGQVGTGEFKTTVENTAGRSMDGWIERHVVEGQPVDVAAPDNGTLSRSSWGTLAAYHYLTEEIPAALAFYALVWYSILLFVGRLLARIVRIVL